MASFSYKAIQLITLTNRNNSKELKQGKWKFQFSNQSQCTIRLWVQLVICKKIKGFQIWYLTVIIVKKTLRKIRLQSTKVDFGFLFKFQHQSNYMITKTTISIVKYNWFFIPVHALKLHYSNRILTTLIIKFKNNGSSKMTLLYLPNKTKTRWKI